MFSVDRTMELTFTAKPRSTARAFQLPPKPYRATRGVTFGLFDQPQLATKPLPPTTSGGYPRGGCTGGYK